MIFIFRWFYFFHHIKPIFPLRCELLDCLWLLTCCARYVDTHPISIVIFVMPF